MAKRRSSGGTPRFKSGEAKRKYEAFKHIHICGKKRKK
jgi:hypothetical protein